MHVANAQIREKLKDILLDINVAKLANSDSAKLKTQLVVNCFRITIFDI